MEPTYARRAARAYRGHRITVARGRVAFSICRRIGPEWATDVRIFAVCSSAVASWASAQRDVFQTADIGSEVAAYWIKNVLKMADEMERSNQASDATSEPAPGADSSAHQG